MVAPSQVILLPVALLMRTDETRTVQIYQSDPVAEADGVCRLQISMDPLAYMKRRKAGYDRNKGEINISKHTNKQMWKQGARYIL